MRSGHPSPTIAEPFDAVAFRSPRFWVPRGAAPDLSDAGYLVDPQPARLTPESAVPFEALADFPVLGLLGEPGMGKSTVLKNEARKIQAAAPETGDQLLHVDLAACGTDVLVCQRIFESKEFRSWKKSKGRLHLLLDGFDTCLQYVEPLVGLLLDRLGEEPRDRLFLRIACRTADWPADLEIGLQELWREQTVGIFELAPLRQKDVRAAAEATGCPTNAFLAEVDRLSAAQFANRPITLRFLLSTFHTGKGLPLRRTDLYREGCLVLCDEWRHDLRRPRRSQSLSSGLRFAVAGRLAAISVFSRGTAIWTAPRRDPAPEGDVRIDELLGGEERFEREATAVTKHAIGETMETGLFRSAGPHRIAFSHQTYSEYLAAQYLVDHRLPVPEILRLILHADGSGKVVPQLRETAAWLAALVPEVSSALLSKDPAALFASDTPPASEEDRRKLVRQILNLFDNGALHDIQIVAAAGQHQEGARIKYAGIAKDLEPYLIDGSRSALARRAAVKIAELTQQRELQQHLLRLALDEEEPHNLRVAAAVAVRTIGDEHTKAGLKPLVHINPANDPNDDLKGNALSAIWPLHLGADELFEALTSPQQPNYIGQYQRFLLTDLAAQLRTPDMARAVRWARAEAAKNNVKTSPLGRAALEVITAAIDCFHETGVCDELANSLVEIAGVPVPHLPLMRKLSSTPNARTALARVAIRASPDLWTTHRLGSYGLFQDGDIPFLLEELNADPSRDVQERLAYLIAGLLRGVPWFDTELIERVLKTASANPVLSAHLEPVLAPIELGSEEAKRLKADHEARLRRQKPTPVAEPASNLDDLIGGVDTGEAAAFVKICHRLAGISWYPDEELLPGWEKLQRSTQTQIVRAAEMYLNGYCVASTSWIDTGEGWYNVTCGYWALRLLTQVAPDILHNLSADTWYAWMPSVFGDSYMRQNPDQVQATILRTAYQRAPARFRELLGRFIDGQNKQAGDVLILNRVTPVWDREIADLLRAKLVDSRLALHAFRSILATLMKASDEEAVRIATDLVNAASNAPPAEMEKPIEAALELFDNNPSDGWLVVWPAAKANHEFAEGLFRRLARDPYSSATTRVVEGLLENELAELQIWLSQQIANRAEGAEDRHQDLRAGPFAVITPDRDWYWLHMVVMNNLIQRGTPEAIKAIRRIDEKAPDENLKRVEQVAQEFVWQKTWIPLSPAEFFDLVINRAAAQSRGPTRDEPPTHPESDENSGQPSRDIATTREERQFRKTGDTWHLQFDHTAVSVKHRIGMAYVAHLLRSPGRSFSCVDLQVAECGNAHRRPLLDENERTELDPTGSLRDEILDETARKNYKERLDSIESELRQAEDDNDVGRVENLRGEEHALINALKTATGLAGRHRTFATDAEKARKAVSRAINGALKTIEKHHPQLAKHLNERITRGVSCCYTGDGITWEV